jgi:AraC family transcriptional regulator
LLAAVQRQLDEEVDLTALAERFGYSPFHFHRVFTKSVGETPKAHIARLRLEKAFLLIAVTQIGILEIALSVGFKDHETFTRAFKRQFGMTPRKLRADARQAERRQPEQVEHSELSDVSFLRLPPMHMLAVRRIGPYAEAFPPPYSDGDQCWSALVAWAEANQVGYSRLAYGFYLDMPGITPDEAMRADLCIEIDREISGDEQFAYFPFAGGEFGQIEHRGSYATLPQAYHALVSAILDRSEEYVLNGAPPFQVHREICIAGDPASNLTDVYFPVARSG